MIFFKNRQKIKDLEQRIGKLEELIHNNLYIAVREDVLPHDPPWTRGCQWDFLPVNKAVSMLAGYLKIRFVYTPSIPQPSRFKIEELEDDTKTD